MMLDKLMGKFKGNLTTSKWAKMTKVPVDIALRDITDLVNKEVPLNTNSGGRSTNYELNWLYFLVILLILQHLLI